MYLSSSPLMSHMLRSRLLCLRLRGDESVSICLQCVLQSVFLFLQLLLLRGEPSVSVCCSVCHSMCCRMCCSMCCIIYCGMRCSTCCSTCCNVLQCVAVCCSVMQWVVVGCSGLQWVAMYCRVLQRIAVCAAARCTARQICPRIFCHDLMTISSHHTCLQLLDRPQHCK